MKEEMEAHRMNRTWRVVESVPNGKNIVGSRWVFKRKV
jgi:hypothetical protein